MTPKLYMSEICPSVRAVLLTAETLGVTLEQKQVELSGMSPKILLKHSLPILEDNHFIIWDSHAIIAYLIGKYGQDDSLYPKNKDRKALIDERLNFDSGVVSFFTETILKPLIRGKSLAIPEDFVEIFENTYAIVETFFDGNKWIAGDSLTIADLCLIPSITSLDVLVKIDEKYPEIRSWIKRAEKLPCYAPNETGLCKLREIVRSRKF